MRVLTRHLFRLLAFLLLLTLLVGVPVAVLVLMGRPMPTASQWRVLWRAHRLDAEVVVRVGAAMFLLLWAWFAVTALAELRRVLLHRGNASALPPLRRGGPAAAVAGLVRFVALSSVGAGLLSSGLVGTGHAQVPTSISHVVVAGDSYWDIAEGHLHQVLGRDATNSEVMALTDELVERNAPLLGHRDPTLLVPGETVVIDPVVTEPVAVAPVATRSEAVAMPRTATAVAVDPPSAALAVPTSEPPVATATTVAVAVPATAAPVAAAVTRNRVPSNSSHREGAALPGLAGALLLAGGALITLESRRRRALCAVSPDVRLAAPSFAQARTELLLRTLDPAERLARLDLALRAAARDLATQGAVVVAAAVHDSGAVTLHLRGSALPSSDRWRADIASGVWHLPAATTLEELAAEARDGVAPCPALVHVGMLDDEAALFLDLEAFGVVSVSGQLGSAFARAVVASLAVSPFRNVGRLRAVGVTGLATGDAFVDAVEFGDDAHLALAEARAEASLVSAWSAGTSTFALRASADSGEAWEPSVVVIDTGSDVVVPTVDVREGAGLAVLVVGEVPGSLRLVEDGDHLVCAELGVRFQPVVVDDVELHAVGDLLDAEPMPLEQSPTPAVVPERSAGEYVEPAWDLRVRTIGAVFVETAEGAVATFERSKSLELVVWMALHRERSTRSGARAAMWEVGVRSATFANVVSEARRALGALIPPPDGEDWIGRTLTDDLPLHPRVVTDGELLQSRLDASRALTDAEAIAMLRPGLELVTGLPFSSPCFAWVDGEGHTSALVLLATGAAMELAQRHLALGDIEGVFWATGQGLRVLPGHEGLIAIRMRAHASCGDLAGVRLEWEQYERALAADTWSPGEPSPKLVALRRELLGQPMARAGAPVAYLSSP